METREPGGTGKEGGMSMSRFQKAIDELFDFVIRVSSKDKHRTEAELAILPQIAKLILHDGRGSLIPSPLSDESDENSSCPLQNAVFQLSICPDKPSESK